MESSDSPVFSNTQYSINIKAPDYSILSDDRTSSPDGFFIAYKVMENSENYYYEPEDDDWYLDSSAFIQTNYLSFHAGRDKLLEKLSACSEISRMLDEVNIPMDARLPLISKIQDAIVSIANDPACAAHKIIPILVAITASTCYDVTENLRLSEGPKFTVAAKSAVALLAKVKLDALNANDQETACPICFEDFLQDAQLISMPCKHVFHGECITKWLQKSNLCPTCRFEMPVDPSE